MNIPGYTIIGPLCYQGKVGCESVVCGRMMRRDESGKLVFAHDRCRGYHCSYCDQPCGSQGHRCDAANTILGEAERLLARSETGETGDAT